MSWGKVTISPKNDEKKSKRSLGTHGVMPNKERSFAKFVFASGLFKLVIAAVIVGVLRHESLRINTITVSGARAVDADHIRDVAQKFISGYYVWLIPRSNVLLISKNKWEQAIQAEFPSLEKVTIEIPERLHAQIIVREHKPHYVWCSQGSVGSEQSLKTETSNPTLENCYFIDDKGTIFDFALSFSRGVYVTFRGGALAHSENPIKQSIAPAETFSYTTAIVRGLSDMGISAQEVTFASDGDIVFSFEDIAGVHVGVNAKLLSNQKISSDQVLTMARLLLADKVFLTQLQKSPRSLEYIDLRFEGKIIYKFGQGQVMTSGS